MENNSDFNIDEDTISKLGLRPADKMINAQISPEARVFIYPFLEEVYIMESDLYGNTMPRGSCFLAFNGHHGMMGRHLKVETLRDATIKEIQDLVENNKEG